jgi:hypothetical protein
MSDTRAAYIEMLKERKARAAQRREELMNELIVIDDEIDHLRERLGIEQQASLLKVRDDAVAQ